MQIENSDAESRPDEFMFCATDGLVWSESNRQAFAELSAATLGTRPIVALIGPEGAGKSVLLAEWRAQCGTTFELAQVDSLPTDPDAAMQDIARVLKIETDAEDKNALIPAFREHLAGLAKAGKSAVLAVDNAETLAPNILELLRMLAGIKKSGRALLRLVLVGDEALRGMLETNARPGAGEQVRVLELKGLEPEAVERLARSVLQADDRGDLEFAPGAIDALIEVTEALPGRITTRVHELATNAKRHKHRRITADHVKGTEPAKEAPSPAEPLSREAAAENLSAAGRRMVGGRGELPTSIRNAEDPRQLLRWAFNMPSGRAADTPVDVPLPTPAPAPKRVAPEPALRRELPVPGAAAGDMPPGLGPALARLAQEEVAERAAIEAREAADAVRAAQIATDPVLTARAARNAQAEAPVPVPVPVPVTQEAPPAPEPEAPPDVELDLRRAFVETQVPHKKGRGLLMSGALATAIVAGALGWPILREALLVDPSSPDVSTVVMTEGSTGRSGTEALVLLDGPGPNHLEKITGLRALADIDAEGGDVLADIEAFRPNLTVPEQLAILGPEFADPSIENRKTNLAVLEHIGLSTERSRQVVRDAEAEIASLKSASEAEVTELAARLAQLTSDVAAMETDARNLAEATRLREAELGALDERIAAAQSREEELRQSIDRRENDLVAVEDATRASLSDLEALRADIAAADAERAEADAALASLRSEQQALRDQVSDGGRLTEGLAAQISAAEARLAGLTGQAGALTEEIATLQADRDLAAGLLTETRQALDTAENSLESASRELAERVADRDRLNAELAEITAKKDAIGEEVAALDAARDAATDVLATTQAGIRTAEVALAELAAQSKAEDAAAAARRTAAIEDFAALDAERAAILQEIEGIAAKREDAARSLKQAEAEVAALVSDLASREGALAQTEARIVAASDDLTSRREDLRLAEKALAETQEARDLVEMDLARLVADADEQRSELSDLGETIAMRQFEAAALTATLQNAEEAVASVKADMRDAEAQRQVALDEAARIRAEIADAEVQLAALTEETTTPGGGAESGDPPEPVVDNPPEPAAEPPITKPSEAPQWRARNNAAVLAALAKAPGLSKVSAADKEALALKLTEGVCVQDALRDVVGRINRYTLAALVRNLEKCSS